ncbi:MAG: hypothetical protein EP297_04595 [Gammaproteobacteria bacterium]|nr:MAG: hypothetical protein EP297_04595 [Gammaproteobacteria bacterium]
MTVQEEELMLAKALELHNANLGDSGRVYADPNYDWFPGGVFSSKEPLAMLSLIEKFNIVSWKYKDRVFAAPYYDMDETSIFEDDFDSKFVKSGDNRAEAVHNCAVQILKSQT